MSYFDSFPEQFLRADEFAVNVDNNRIVCACCGAQVLTYHHNLHFVHEVEFKCGRKLSFTTFKTLELESCRG